ncbi:MAG: alpha/beta hydrolase, partial [Verrucomicrobiales bacterium]
MNSDITKTLLLMLIICLAPVFAVAAPPDVPSTISEEAKKAAATLVLDQENRAPGPNDIEGWESYWKQAAEGEEEAGMKIVEKLGATVEKLELGGVPVLDIKPKSWKDNGKVLVYTHGGAYTLFSASTTLSSSVPVADLTGLRIISVDYTVAPHQKWEATTSQVVSVIKALIGEGYGLKDIAIFGDSAGGGMAAGSVLKARDEGVGLVAAVVLWSPWS